MCRLSQNIILNAKYWYVKLGTLLCNTCGNLFIYIIRSRIIRHPCYRPIWLVSMCYYIWLAGYPASLGRKGVRKGGEGGEGGEGRRGEREGGKGGRGGREGREGREGGEGGEEGGREGGRAGGREGPNVAALQIAPNICDVCHPLRS